MPLYIANIRGNMYLMAQGNHEPRKHCLDCFTTLMKNEDSRSKSHLPLCFTKHLNTKEGLAVANARKERIGFHDGYAIYEITQGDLDVIL